MPMLIFETFLLLLGSTLLGVALGHLFFEAFGARVAVGEADEPWLRPLAPVPPIPMLPAPPTLLDDAERERLAAAAARAAAPVESGAPVAAAGPTPSDVVPIAADALERARAADAVGARPAARVAAEVDGGDDLEAIKGIGPQNARRLHALGIWHFDQIAAWTPDNSRWVGSFLAFPGRIEREDWVGQAKAFVTAAKK